MNSLRERSEDRNAAQMRIERAGAIVAFQLRAERLVALQDVEHVAQHFQHHAIGLRAYGRRARVVTHAGHFAEHFAGIQFGDGFVVRQIDRSIDGNEWAVGLLRCDGPPRADEQAFQFAEESFAAALASSRARSGWRENLRLAFENVKRSRTELSLAADDLSRFEMPLYDCLLVQLEECARDILENRQMQELSGIENIALAQLCPTTRLLVSAPVGHETMHSPQETHDDSPMGKLLSKAMPAWYPLPRRASTQLCRMSSQPRMQRSHRMQAS